MTTFLIIFGIIIIIAIMFVLYAVIKINTDEYDSFDKDIFKIIEEQEKKNKK